MWGEVEVLLRGYVMLGEPVTTPLGYIVHLVRSTQAGMFGEEADSVWLSLERQTETRIRIKITDDKHRFEIEGEHINH